MRNRGLNLFQKFTLVIICVGFIPMSILSTLIINRMLTEYGNSLRSNYEQAAYYINDSIENSMESYGDISKVPYYYNYSSEGEFQYNYMSFDNLRRIVYGIGYEPDKMEEIREQNMGIFLRNVQNVDSSIDGVHFAAVDSKGNAIRPFHSNARNYMFSSSELFTQRLQLDQIDYTSKQMILIPSHKNDYVIRGDSWVFTVARNYFDLTQAVGTDKYVGTIFIDIYADKLKSALETVHLNEQDIIYVSDENGNCYYSNDSQMIGVNLIQHGVILEEDKENFVINTPTNSFGLKVTVVMKTATAYQKIEQMRNMMYLFLGASVLALLIGSVIFSKRLTKPIRNMMEQMSAIESGNFKVELPVTSNDEIGTLSRRFNKMSLELENYINQSYVAQIKQNEAEMTALKAQIYPHFLYNTLEIIRMTALENEDNKVSKMIEALSQQIHYIIGPVQDMVPLEMEIDIIKKYIYLLNCRIAGKIQLSVEMNGFSKVSVPKLILQPIVENAYVHGIKPKDGMGAVMIDVELHDQVMEIALMDNGVGMDEAALEKLHQLLDSDEIGIKNEHNWQSIGLKNVHDRVRYMYGETFGIRVTSTPMVGTMVRILLPYDGVGGEINGSDDFGG